MTNTETGPYRGRRLTREEFRELLHDWYTEVEARAAGFPVPPPTAKRRALPVRPLSLDNRPIPTPRTLTAANDNHRQTPVIPATQSTPHRIENALSPALRRTLFRLRELARPVDMSAPDMVLAAANTNAKDDTGIGIDSRHDVDPGDVEDLIAAYADGMRSRVVVRKDGRVERFQGGIRYHRSVRESGEIVEVGGHSSLGKFFGLRVHRGKIVAYAKNEKREQPKYEVGDPRGSDDAELPRETTASAAAHPVLAELDRADAFTEFCARVEPRTAGLLRIIMDADNFQEVARAAEMTPTAHNGRRVTEKLLSEVQKLLAA